VSGRQDPGVASEPSKNQTPEQRRAADALRAVQALEADEAFRKRYRAYADRIGPTILMNGLGQALVTERAAAGSTPKKADERAHDRLYRNIEAWLCRAGGVYEPKSGQGRDLLQAIVQRGEGEYLRAQAEALAWLVWHKKFCRAYLPPADDEES
jgi:CRISPR-associated protein Cmr5